MVEREPADPTTPPHQHQRHRQRNLPNHTQNLTQTSPTNPQKHHLMSRTNRPISISKNSPEKPMVHHRPEESSVKAPSTGASSPSHRTISPPTAATTESEPQNKSQIANQSHNRPSHSDPAKRRISRGQDSLPHPKPLQTDQAPFTEIKATNSRRTPAGACLRDGPSSEPAQPKPDHNMPHSPLSSLHQSRSRTPRHRSQASKESSSLESTYTVTL